jgi:hypothetical protein
MSQQAAVTERRTSSRHQLSLPWSATTTMNGQDISAEMVDISIHGAKIRLPQLSSQHMLVPGTEMVWNIAMPSGKEVEVNVLSRWVHRFPEGYILGVSFIDNELISSELKILHEAQV